MRTVATRRRWIGPLVAGVLAALGLMATAQPAQATWSIIVVDRTTGQVVVASATCVSQGALRRFPSEGLMDIQAVVVPGVGVAVAQAGVDRSRENQWLIHRELQAGTSPARIIEMLHEDPDIQRRQFGIVDLQGRSAGFSGSGNTEVSLAVQGGVPEAGIVFSVQGNILASEAVVHDAVEALVSHQGPLTDRVMSAMEAADAAGGDRRCTCETEPVPEAVCTHRTAHVAYVLAADADDAPGESYNDGDWSLFIDVTDENIRPDEDANPVRTLRMRYDAWKAGGGIP
jgi:uncharacterized Ntn-hydrolase superfamily protein